MKLRAKKLPQQKIEIEDIISQFCYYYPQYTYVHAKKVPFKRILLMLRVAEKEQAKLLSELTQIAAAPHTKDGEGVKNLLSKYEDIIKR